MESPMSVTFVLVFLLYIYFIEYTFSAGLSLGIHVQWNKMYFGDEVRRMSPSNLDRCIQECWNRQSCKSVSYNREIPLCNLHSTDNANVLQNFKGFIHMKKSQFEKTSSDVCNVSTCPALQSCDDQRGSCSFQECEAPPAVPNTIRMGNRVQIGSKIKYRCTHIRDQVQASTCQLDGTWTNFPLQACCGDLPHVKNAAVEAGGFAVGDQRTYYCETYFVAKPVTGSTVVLTTTCDPSGRWTLTDFECVANTIGHSCTSGLQCKEDNSRCVDGICFCNTLYEYDSTRGTCKKVCRSLGTEWVAIPETYIAGYNWKNFEDSVDNCKADCIRMGNDCVNFDYSSVSGKCFMNKVSIQHIRNSDPTKERFFDTTVLYERVCVPI